MSDYLTCREMIDFLMDYVNGELDAATRHEFDRHLKVCPPCVDFLQNYRQTVDLVRASGREPDAPDREKLPEELVQAILRAQKRTHD